MDVKCYICKCEFKASPEQKNIFSKQSKCQQEGIIWLCDTHACSCMKCGELPLSYAYQCGFCKKNYYCMQCGVFQGGDTGYLASKCCYDCE